ncbi:MAG: cupin domain-containing protein [Candidatus Eremiobacteraeota bacterium]|nr:cupin domain-containing protein [Candidatus Eremiobacteraeota bacterium]
MHPQAALAIAELGLVAHPEGGYYREIYRSATNVRAADGRGRPALTVIYFLLESTKCSTWHRLKSDETWHFARGHLVLELIAGDGAHERLELNPEGPWQATIPAGTAFAARARSDYALVTCCVAPGFAFEDFELLDPGRLRARYPEHSETIARYARQ